MEFNEVIQRRHSTRYFSDLPMQKEIITAIIAEATRIPTWINAQEHRVYVATGKTLESIRKEYEDRAKEGLIGVSDFTVVHREDWSKTAQQNMSKFYTEMENNLGDSFGDLLHVQDCLFNAPALIILTLPKNSSKWAIIDLGAFEYAILLSATNREIQSIVAYSITKYPDIIRKHLPISPDEDVALGIAIGHEDSTRKINQHHSERMDLSEILTIKS